MYLYNAALLQHSFISYHIILLQFRYFYVECLKLFKLAETFFKNQNVN